MKRIVLLSLFSCVISCSILLSQGTPGIQIQMGFNLNQVDFDSDFIDPTFMQGIPHKVNLGYSFGFNGELPLTTKQSLIVGIAATQVTLYPRMDYGLWYGLVIQDDEGYHYLNPSYLQRMRFDLLEIPVSWRYYLFTEKKVRPYAGFGISTSFAWRERERWRSMIDQSEFISNDEQLYEYESKQKDFRHFRTALTLNFGAAFSLHNKWDLMIDVQSNLVTQRRYQESSVASYIPEYWGDDLHWLGQTSLNIGLRRKL